MLNPLQKIYLGSILKAKARAVDNGDELIERWINENAKNASEKSAKFFSDLIVFVNNNSHLAQEDILRFVSSRIEQLGITFDGAEIESIYIKAAEDAIKGGKIIFPPLETPLLQGENHGAKPRDFRPREEKIKFVFDKKDLGALEAVNKQFVWLGKDATEWTQNKMREIATAKLNGEIGINEMGEALAGAMGDFDVENHRYYRDAMRNFVRQSQSISRVNQYIKHNAPAIKVVARMDGKTSPICVSMNGRIIPMAHIQTQLNAILSAENENQKQEAAAWFSKPVFGKLPRNLGLPPYHYNCRTIVEPFYPDEYEEELKYEKADGDIEDRKMKLTGSMKKGDRFFGVNTAKNRAEKSVLFSHIDKTGVERVITEETYNHPSESDKPAEGNIAAALNSIKRIAQHNLRPDRMVTVSENNIALVLDGQEVWTAIQHRNAKAALEYFRKFASQSTEEVIKWQQNKTQDEKWSFISAVSSILKNAAMKLQKRS